MRTRATRVYRLLRSGEKQAKKGGGGSSEKAETIAAEYDPTGMLVDPTFFCSSPPENQTCKFYAHNLFLFSPKTSDENFLSKNTR